MLSLLCFFVTPTAGARPEVFAFSVRPDFFERWDWGRLTTVAWRNEPAVVALAHSHGARVVAGTGGLVVEQLANATWRRRYVEELVSKVLERGQDGVNFDLEAPLAGDDPANLGYAALIRETKDALDAALGAGRSQVSVDVAWSPDGIDGRNYAAKELGAAADVVFVMHYDTQSQVLQGRCVAGANSPLELARRGVQRWLAAGVPAEKMVLGLPWYGYAYPCVSMAPDGEYCSLPKTDPPFRGASCSDAAGRQITYADVSRFLRHNSTRGRELDWASSSPYFNAVLDGTVSQVWYDDAESIELKARLAGELGLRGVGMYNVDDLDYREDDPVAVAETKAMWSALDGFYAGRAAQTLGR